MLDSHTCADTKACQRTLVAQVHLGTATVVVTERQVEAFALRHDIDRKDRVPEEHVVPFYLVGNDVTRGSILLQSRPFIPQVPLLQVMERSMQAYRRMLEAVVQSQLQVERQHLMILSAFLRVETYQLPSYVAQHQSHLERRVARLEMRTHVGSQCEGMVGLIDRIYRFQRDSDAEHRSQLTGIHRVNQDIFCAEFTAGQVAIHIGIGHIAVVQIVNTYGKVVGLLGFALFEFLALNLGATEVMTIQYRTEHRARQVVREVELQHLISTLTQQGRIAHTHRDIAVAYTNVRTAQSVDAR